MEARFTTGPRPAGVNRRFGPVGGHGGGAMSSATSPAFHQSCIQSSSVANEPETSIDDPAAPEVEARTTGGGSSPEGVGQIVALGAAAPGVAGDPAVHVA